MYYLTVLQVRNLAHWIKSKILTRLHSSLQALGIWALRENPFLGVFQHSLLFSIFKDSDDRRSSHIILLQPLLQSYVHLILFCLQLLRTSVITLAFSRYPRQPPDLEVLDLIKSAKSSLPCRVIYSQVLEGQDEKKIFEESRLLCLLQSI